MSSPELRTVVVGLLAIPPDLPAVIAAELAHELPGVLASRITDRVKWDVRYAATPIPVLAEGTQPLLDAVRERMGKDGWDIGIGLTDIPISHEGQPEVVRASLPDRAALVSLPALGVAQQRKHAEEAIIALVEELSADLIDLPRDDDASISERLAERVPPIRGAAPSPDAGEVHLVSTRGGGLLRLVGGMVEANQPWRVVVGLSKLLVGALATAAFGLVTPPIWMLSDALNPWRLALLAVVSIGALVTYLIAAHGLWERASARVAPAQARLFNTATVLTVLMAVAFFYVTLYVLLLLASVLILDGSVVGQYIKHDVGAREYLLLAWMLSSMAMLGGALGSGLESDEDVRAAAYGYHPDSGGDDASEMSTERASSDSAA
jgi:uncharacterized membrane protein